MGQKIVVGPINKGLKNDVTPFSIDNDSFPVLINAYQWRGRVKRKRGTSFLGRLTRYFNSASLSYNSGATFITLDGSGNGNLLTGFSLQTNGNIVPTSVRIDDLDSPGLFYTDPAGDGNLVGNPSGTGTINYATGDILIAVSLGHRVTAIFLYYPDLPVMGLEDLTLNVNTFPGTMGFDTKYSYNITTAFPFNIYDVSFYKNPPASASLTGYVQKSIVTPTSWNGQDYQQFWTVNYQGAIWATNGINIPFSVTNVGMQYKPITGVVYAPGPLQAGPPAIANLTIVAHGLSVGDFVFINEVGGITGINFQTGYVVTVVDPNTVTVEFPNATLGGAYTSGGIAQYLTNRSDITKDCLRWYDGDPTNGSATAPVLNGNKGWVNFAPPINNIILFPNFSVADLPPQQYYLVGARMIIPFKDCLLFLGPVVQTSAAGSQVYLQDTIIYSQNGTAYYTSSYTGDPSLSTTVFHPILVPQNQTANSTAYWEDLTGFGGFVTAGVDQPINGVSSNEDVLIVGFKNLKTKLVYTGNNLIPFNFYTINSELGTASPFSSFNLDEGVVDQGDRGFTITGQTEVRRVDLDIPDEVFQIKLTENGTERICSQRDFINEWAYFTYPNDVLNKKFPSQTLQFNYRDNSWAIFHESYTTYGAFRQSTGYTWATIGTKFSTWSKWNEPWNAGSTTLLQPQVIAGNQQGFIVFRDDGTNESNSLYIKNITFPVTITGATNAASAVITAINQFVVGQQVTISGILGMIQLNGNRYTITSATPTTFTLNVNSTAFGVYISGGLATPYEPIYSPDHSLNNGDFIIISGALGTVGSTINNKIYSITKTTVNGFTLNPQNSTVPTSGTYLGGGVIKRIYRPFIQTKQFPAAWSESRKTRLGVQQYLLSTTSNAQVTLLIYLSQDADNAYNAGSIVPDVNSMNDSLVYSTILYTCPESTNLGLTPANINLNMVTTVQQAQTWHRMNTSLLGDTVQIGLTLSDAQMRDVNQNYQFAEIELHGFILDLNPSMLLS